MNANILIPAIIFYFMYAILRELFNYLTKRKLIASGYIDKANVLGNIDGSYPDLHKYNSLKWGLVSFFAGVALLIVALVPAINQLEEPLRFTSSLGVIMVSVAIAFILHFVILMRMKK